MRFIVLLWGEKSSLVSEGNKEVPVFTFMEIIGLGRESRRALFDSHNDSMSLGSFSTNSEYTHTHTHTFRTMFCPNLLFIESHTYESAATEKIINPQNR